VFVFSPDGSGILFFFSLKKKRFSGQQEQCVLIKPIVVLHKTKKAPVLQLMLS